MVMANSLVKFEGPAVELEHGAVRVTTSRGLAAHAGDVTVKPAGNSWTEFQVTDVDGRVQIAANKGDVTVQDDKGTTTVTQGQQTTRDDTTDTREKEEETPASGWRSTGSLRRNHEFDSSDCNRVWSRGWSWNLVVVGPRCPGKSCVSDEPLPVILLRTSSGVGD